MCDHNFSYRGPVTWPAKNPLPGSGAHARIYADAFFCTKCCESRLTNERLIGNTYEHARFGAIEYPSRPE